MIPHHSQAVEMATLAGDRADSEQVKQLATRIQLAQGPEVEQMRGLLDAWGKSESFAAASGGSTGGVDHNSTGSGEPGMMTSDQMKQLAQVSGVQFDRMFLQMMTAHHQGAIQLALTELNNGQNPDAYALAQTIIETQKAEITEMQTLLTKH